LLRLIETSSSSLRDLYQTVTRWQLKVTIMLRNNLVPLVLSFSLSPSTHPSKGTRICEHFIRWSTSKPGHSPSILPNPEVQMSSMEVSGVV
jgi:hypothetical protein